MSGIRVTTASRLHFGLLSWGNPQARQFGGCGLMIAQPAVVIEAARARAWQVEGPQSARVERLLKEIQECWHEDTLFREPCRIVVRDAPPEHVGLGVGTQLSLAVARALFELLGEPNPPLERLACLTGRGKRSGIGLHGFAQGGFLVDGGRKSASGIPPLLSRLTFPAAWSVVLVIPRASAGLHGVDELQAFEHLPAIAPAITAELCRIVLLELMPAVVEHDLETFGQALGTLQRTVGSCFAPAQGGVYHARQSEQIITALGELGFQGAGQSSWGPALYAFSDRPGSEIAAAVDALRARFEPELAHVLVTRAADSGASLTRLD